ncbi:O-antigen ligase [Paenibacillus sp. UNCCL117]|uniref:hypothetical protein n=1 Tax=unclassified Paenibacillus TaxID=185978 RepID=UPI000890F865|nr:MULTISPECIES: hypothetical protein [unclassified Paenibacillus]SDC04461.1 O-antigen ligase [Paenibacillus sp. cl123]SFW37327.1 O-antigen ligase [Paenibacillus sp. UNCCL117]
MRLIKNNGDNLIINKKVDQPVIYFFILFITFCFAISGSVESSRVVYVYHIKANVLYVTTLICILFVLGSFFKRPLFDKITLGLFYGAILSLIPIVYAEITSSYWGNYFPLLISLTSYYICMKSTLDFTNKIFKIVCLISVIISIQVIMTELHYFSNLSFGNFSNIAVKGFMNLPIGSSNLIAAYLLPLLIFIITFKRNRLTIIISGLILYALVLCRSKNALSLVVLFLFFIVVKKIYKFVVSDKSVDRKTKLYIIVFLTAVLGCIFIFVLQFLGVIVSDLQFTTYNTSYTNPYLSFIDKITSGRLLILENELLRFSQHIFLGNGFGYVLGQSKSHNWIIELLVQRGIIGFIIYIYCIVKVFKRGIQFYKLDTFIRAGINLLFIIFIQGLFEVTIFTTGIEFLTWSISGFIIARSSFLDKSGE